MTIRVSELFKGHGQLIMGFNNFLPPEYKIELPDESNSVPPASPDPVSSAVSAISEPTTVAVQSAASVKQPKSRRRRKRTKSKSVPSVSPIEQKSIPKGNAPERTVSKVLHPQC